MTDPSVPENTPLTHTNVPSVAERLIEAGADKAATALATVLLSAGLLSPSGETQFVAVAAGLLVAALNLGWTYALAHRHDLRLRAAVSSPASLPVSK